MASVVPRRARSPVAASGAQTDGKEPDCRTCALRAQCISYGWMSPGGLWFENAVVLRPTPGCRGYVGRGADILGHFGEQAEGESDPEDPPTRRD